MAPKRIKVKPGKTQSKMGFIVGILFVVLGVFVVIPTFGLFGLIWTGVAAMIAFMNYKNGFSDEKQIVKGKGGGVLCRKKLKL